jgi:hypothetical protein
VSVLRTLAQFPALPLVPGSSFLLWYDEYMLRVSTETLKIGRYRLAAASVEPSLPGRSVKGSVCGASHAVACENLFTTWAQAGALHLKALLNGTVVAEILAAKTRSVARAGRLLLLCSGVLGKCSTIADKRCCNAKDNRWNAHGFLLWSSSSCLRPIELSIERSPPDQDCSSKKGR